MIGTNKIGRPSKSNQLLSNADFTYFLIEWERKTEIPPSADFSHRLVAGQDDPNVAFAAVVITDLFDEIPLCVGNYDCRWWVSSSGAPGTLRLQIQRSQGTGVVTNNVDTEGWTNGCDSANGARITGEVSRRVFHGQRDPGSNVGYMAMSADRGGSTPSPCSGNFATANMILRVPTAKLMSFGSFEDSTIKMKVRKL